MPQQSTGPTGKTGGQSVQGLATIVEGCAQTLRGVSEHLSEMGVQQALRDRLQECEQMCMEIRNDLR